MKLSRRGLLGTLFGVAASPFVGKATAQPRYDWHVEGFVHGDTKLAYLYAQREALKQAIYETSGDGSIWTHYSGYDAIAVSPEAVPAAREYTDPVFSSDIERAA